MHHLSSLLFFCGDIYLSFGISLLASFDDNSLECSSFEWNSFRDFFDVLVILSEILLPIKSPVPSAVF